MAATAFKNLLTEQCLKFQLPATQTFPFNGREELDCAANRSLVVSRSHDFMELHQTHKTHDMAKSSPLLSFPFTVVLTEIL